MKGAPWFPFYPADFLGGTFAMDAAEVGAYVRLLCLQWQGGGLPNDPVKLAALSGHAFAYATASKFRVCEDGLLRNDRLEECRKKAGEKSQAASTAAHKRWNGEKKDDANAYANAYANAMRGQRSEVRGQNTEDREQSSSPHKPPAKLEAIVDDPDAGYPQDFLAFWKAFPGLRKKKKSAALRSWKAATKKRTPAFIMASLERHKESCDDWLKDGGQFIPGPEVWLNGGGYDAADALPKPEPIRYRDDGTRAF